MIRNVGTGKSITRIYRDNSPATSLLPASRGPGDSNTYRPHYLLLLVLYIHSTSPPFREGGDSRQPSFDAAQAIPTSERPAPAYKSCIRHSELKNRCEPRSSNSWPHDQDECYPGVYNRVQLLSRCSRPPSLPRHVSGLFLLGAVLLADPPGIRGSSELEFALISHRTPTEQCCIVFGAAHRDRRFLDNWKCSQACDYAIHIQSIPHSFGNPNPKSFPRDLPRQPPTSRGLGHPQLWPSVGSRIRKGEG